MALPARTAAVIALAAMLSPAPQQIRASGPPAVGIELAYLPWAKPNQPWINGEVWPTGGRHLKRPRYSPPPPGNRWRNALLAPEGGTETPT